MAFFVGSVYLTILLLCLIRNYAPFFCKVVGFYLLFQQQLKLFFDGATTNVFLIFNVQLIINLGVGVNYLKNIYVC